MTKSKSYIYQPRGRAYEYSPWALNHYLGCDHGCTYCYNKFRFPNDDARVRAIDHHKFRQELKDNAYTKQVLLSFVGDPYCHAEMIHKETRWILGMLLDYDVPVAVLTKGGTRCLRDINIFTDYPDLIKVGATLTFLDDEMAKEFEPFSAPPSERLAALETLWESNVKTWVSIEPVLDPDQSLAVMRRCLPFVDEFRIGKLNHDKEREAKIDWPDFAKRARDILQPFEKLKSVYFKIDLRESAPDVELPVGWDDMGW